MANEDVTGDEILIGRVGMTLAVIEEIRKSAFMAGYRSLEDLNLEDEFFAEQAEIAYKEWVASLNAKT